MAKKKTVSKTTVPKKTASKKTASKKTATAGNALKMKATGKKAAAKTATQATAKASTKVTAKPTNKATAKPTTKPVLKLVKSAASLKFDFQPLDDRILVERAAESNMTAGGLYIPDTVTERPTKGVVKAVGRGHQDKKGRIRPLDVKVGDTVLFTTYAGSEVEFAGGTYLILRETDLLGVSAD